MKENENNKIILNGRKYISEDKVMEILKSGIEKAKRDLDEDEAGEFWETYRDDSIRKETLEEIKKEIEALLKHIKRK